MKPDPIPTPPTPDSEAHAMVEYLMDEHAPATLEAMAEHLESMFDMDTLDMPQGLRNLLDVTAINLRTIITLAAAYEASR